MLRTYVTVNISHVEICSINTLHIVCFMHGLSIYEIKKVSPCSVFHNLTHVI